jgi:hypothetical protein
MAEMKRRHAMNGVPPFCFFVRCNNESGDARVNLGVYGGCDGLEGLASDGCKVN